MPPSTHKSRDFNRVRLFASVDPCVVHATVQVLMSDCQAGRAPQPCRAGGERIRPSGRDLVRIDRMTHMGSQDSGARSGPFGWPLNLQGYQGVVEDLAEGLAKGIGRCL